MKELRYENPFPSEEGWGKGNSREESLFSSEEGCEGGNGQEENPFDRGLKRLPNGVKKKNWMRNRLCRRKTGCAIGSVCAEAERNSRTVAGENIGRNMGIISSSGTAPPS